MSYYDYVKGRELAAQDVGFHTLIHAAIRRADTENTEKLRAAWPEIYREVQERYRNPGGLSDVELSRIKPTPDG